MEENLPPWHFGSYYKGSIQNWMPTDTYERFTQSSRDPEKLKYLKSQGWEDPDAIEYTINDEGFRSESFNSTDPCLVALGCSFTMGIGLPNDKVWPSVLGKMLGLRVYNLAWGGNSADTCFRIGRYWIPRLKPQVVCMLVPPRSRVELLPINMEPYPPAEVFLPNTDSVIAGVKNDIFLKHWMTNEENQTLNAEKNVLAVKQIALENNAEFAVLYADQEDGTCPDIVGYARDFCHSGPIGHVHLANRMGEQLNKLYG